MTLFYISILILAGLIFSKLISMIRFPEVTGYLVAGILIGPHVLGLLPKAGVDSLEIISELALCFIAFSIGSEMKLSVMKKLGLNIITITLFEALSAFVVVLLGLLFLFKAEPPMALVLSAIACATAPAATLLVIKEYKAEGEIVDVLLPVVAIDDAVCIIVFGISSALASSLLLGGELSLVPMLLFPFGKILLALFLGFSAGILFYRVQGYAKNEEELLTMSIGFIFLVAGISKVFGLSDLLSIMAASVTMSNIGRGMPRSINLISRVTPPIFVLFFVLAGADLNLAGLLDVGAVGVFYIIGRAVGKYIGAYVSTGMTGFGKNIQKNLGLTLIPQAGVAIGLSLLASKTIPDPYGSQIRTIILGATIVYELVGPLFAKLGLKRAGAIQQ